MPDTSTEFGTEKVLHDNPKSDSVGWQPMDNTERYRLGSLSAAGVASPCVLPTSAGASARMGFPELGRMATTHTFTSCVSYGGDINYYSSNNENNFTGNSAHNTAIAPVSVQLVPPQLPRIVPIPLPALSPNVPVQIHALITYCRHISPICWNLSLPPSTAHLAIPSIARISNQWIYNAAIVPTTLPSMTIRIRGVERPIVIFPIETGNPIRIVDILHAVYSAVLTEAIEHGTDAGNVLGYYGSGVQTSRDLAVEDAIAADTIGRNFGSRIWWNGLSPSAGEIVVWVLQLRGETRGRYTW